MKRITKMVAVCAAAFVLAGAALIYAVSGPAGPAKAFDGRTVMRMDGRNGFSATINAARKLFSGFYEDEGIADPFEDGGGVYAGGFSAVVAKDGDGYRIQSLEFAASFFRDGRLYTQRFNIREGSVSSYLLSKTGCVLPADAQPLMGLTAKLDAMDMAGNAARLPDCDAYSIELLERAVPLRAEPVAGYAYAGNGSGGLAEVSDTLYKMVISRTPSGIIYTIDDGTGNGMISGSERLYNIASAADAYPITVYTYDTVTEDDWTAVPREVAMVALVKNGAGGYTGVGSVEIEVE
jgi:hypothetical protein